MNNTDFEPMNPMEETAQPEMQADRPQGAPQPRRAQKMRQERPKVRRVGFFTLGIALILTGGCIAASMILPDFPLFTVAKLAPLVLVALAFGVLWYKRRKLRAYVAEQLCSTDFENSRIQYSLTGLPIPTMLVADGRILWYNAFFREKVLNGSDVVTRPVDRVFPDLDLAVCSRPHGQDLAVGERRYTAYAGAAKGSRGASIVYLVDDTFYKQTLEEYTESRQIGRAHV